MEQVKIDKLIYSDLASYLVPTSTLKFEIQSTKSFFQYWWSKSTCTKKDSPFAYTKFSLVNPF